jgi:hypothetical protein
VDVLADQLSCTELVPVCVPFPAREIVAGEFLALLVTVTLPAKLPAARGENVASNVADCPGARIIPAETPLAEKVAPEIMTAETVTFEFPALVRVTPRTLLPPTATFPKLKLEVLVVSVAVAAVPVPLKDTVLVVLAASLMTDTLPDKAPAVFGEKTTLNVAWLPAAIVSGSEMPVIVTPAAVVLACVTVRLDPPPLVIVTDWEAVLPRATLPKLIDAGATEIVAAPDVLAWLEVAFGAPVSPVQPDMEKIAESSRIRVATRMAFLPAKLESASDFPEPLICVLLVTFSMYAILNFGGGGDYCSGVHLKYSGWARKDQ